MSRLPFTIATEAHAEGVSRRRSPRRGDRFDAALYWSATIAAIAALLAGGIAVGYLIGLWLFN